MASVRRPTLLAAVALVAAPLGLAARTPPSADASAACASAELRTRVVRVEHRPVSEAALLIDALLGPCGDFRITKRFNVITISDEQQFLARCALALEKWDVPPLTVDVTVKLILATRTDSLTPGAAGGIPGVSEQLAQLTRYTRFEELGAVTLRATEGRATQGGIGDRFRVRFKVDGVDAERGVIRLGALELFQSLAPLKTGGPETMPLRVLPGIAVNLPEGRTNLIGAPTRDHRRALFLALVARRAATAAAAVGE